MKYINSSVLLENGYKKWANTGIFKRNANCFYQKRFVNDQGSTKYFITIYEYEHENNEINYEVDLQFEKEDYVMNITLFAMKENMTLEEIEREVYAIWYGLDCKYYEE